MKMLTVSLLVLAELTITVIAGQSWGSNVSPMAPSKRSRSEQVHSLPFDSDDSWQSISDVLSGQHFRDIYTGPGALAEPDSSVAAADSAYISKPLTEIEQATHLVMWTMLGSGPSDQTILVGSNSPSTKSAGLVDQDGHGGEVWCRLLADGSRAVAVLNLEDTARTVSVQWNSLGLTGLQPVRDLLLMKDDGLQDGTSAVVPGHGCVLLKIGHPRRVNQADITVPKLAIVPGAVWRDESGDIIQAHGAGMIKVGDTFYWFGEDKTHGFQFQNFKCYSSKDLVHWKFESNALPMQPNGDMGPNRVGERPKVLYNKITKKYVMYAHCESPNYADAKVAVAESNSVTGPYSLLASFRPLGHQSRDMTLFEDDNGSAYLIHEDRARGVGIVQLSPDYTTVDHEVALIHHGYEAPAVVKRDGVYYLLGSFMSGWDDNDNQYSTATSMEGPWSDWKNVGVAGTKTYHSQTASILTLKGSKTTNYVYLGDRWKPKNLSDSRYVWLPLYVGNGNMSLGPERPWTINVKTGEMNIIQPWGLQPFHS